MRLYEGNEVQPDLALLRRRADLYPRELPKPEDVLLVIEVSETTLAYDRDVKPPRYAQAGIPEVWIVDLEGCRVESYSAPFAEGYRVSREFGPGERARSVSLEGLSLSGDKILE